MQIFPKLFETFPDAKSLLDAELEELAGYLLVSLEGSQNIIIENVISSDPMSRLSEEMPRGKCQEMRQKYPPKQDNEILLALKEAWQWLEHEGFVAPRPTNLSRERSAGLVTTYFVTRRGKGIKTNKDLEAYRKAAPLLQPQLHSIIAKKVWPLFLRGDYDVAVFQGFKEVEIAVREAGEYAETDYGTDLMRKAFHVENGNLTDPDQPKAEKESISNLFAGAIGYYKNPFSHRDVDVTAEEAAEMIIFASHLLRIVDSRK